MQLTLQAMKTLSELMDQALDLDVETRSRWVADLSTGPHAALQPFLAQMLAKQADMETAFMVRPITLPEFPSLHATATIAELTAGTRIGPYVLQREVGHGGMGAVWLADRVDGALTRQVALKLPTIHLTDALAERFARERDILAQLTHPNIARLYDAGVSENGRPYLALEYVEGKPITEHCDAIKLSVNERLQRFLQVASAVQYAHANLVIHRDLKPSNILVSEDGQVHLLDFGIAKLLDDPKSQAAESELTMIAGRALTLDYASPEQVSGGAVSTASDVYSMGVVLYQLLTGQKPYQLKRGTRAELEEAILTGESTRMSDAVTHADATQARARGLTQARLARALAGDLDTIVNKAMKKDPQQRYTTAAAFAEDIQRHLDGLPVEAQADSWRYRAGKFVARNRLGVAASLAVALALTAGLGTALWQANVATQQALRADAAATTARDEKTRADTEAQTAKTESARADEQARAAQTSASRADAEAEAARKEAQRADREALAAKREATRADQEARLARTETTRGNAVQSYLVDLFSANSNDQKNAIQVRNLNAKQLLDRGAEKLEAAGGVRGEVDVVLFRLFGTLYENLNDYDAAKRLHERSVKVAEAAHGKESKPYALAVMELAWVEGHSQLGKRLDLIREAQVILRRVAPASAELAQALYYEAENIDQTDPARAANAATEALAILENKDGLLKQKATAARALGHAQRGLGNFAAALPAYRRSVDDFSQLSGGDNVEVAESMLGVTACLRQMLRLREAEASAKRTIEIWRPFEPAVIDAKIPGRAHAALLADLGRTGEAQSMLELAHEKLRDVDGKPHALKSAVSVALANVALARGDALKALELAKRSRFELRNRNANILVAVLTLTARAAIDAGELKVARDAVSEAKKVHAERGLPALSVRAVARVAAEVAAMGGDNEAATTELATLSGYGTADTSDALSRLMSDSSRARILALLGRWNEVDDTLAPWLSAPSGLELPTHIRGEMLLLAGEAAQKMGKPEAGKLLLEANEILTRIHVPTSAALARSKALLGQLASAS